jgi:hypothetical protein
MPDLEAESKRGVDQRAGMGEENSGQQGFRLQQSIDDWRPFATLSPLKIDYHKWCRGESSSGQKWNALTE